MHCKTFREPINLTRPGIDNTFKQMNQFRRNTIYFKYMQSFLEQRKTTCSTSILIPCEIFATLAILPLVGTYNPAQHESF